MRITLGHLLADDVTWLEGRFWGLENGAERFTARSSGAVLAVPTIGNPFFNVNSGLATQHFVAGPGFGTNGSINILSRNSLFGGDAWLGAAPGGTTECAGLMFWPAINSRVWTIRWSSRTARTSPAGQPAGTVLFSR